MKNKTEKEFDSVKKFEINIKLNFQDIKRIFNESRRLYKKILPGGKKD